MPITMFSGLPKKIEAGASNFEHFTQSLIAYALNLDPSRSFDRQRLSIQTGGARGANGRTL
jgi:hypothetical protein